jgi:hypothetical protein
VTPKRSEHDKGESNQASLPDFRLLSTFVELSIRPRAALSMSAGGMAPAALPSSNREMSQLALVSVKKGGDRTKGTGLGQEPNGIVDLSRFFN